MVRIKDGAITMYHSSVKSGKGPFSGIQERNGTCYKFASAKSSRIAVLKKVVTNVDTIIADISPVIV